eukprot:GAFH01003241.1.p1 GENE.GAFH01003241.1~~GAFH01003241.1.p1  ORF type:complete len:278 (-),score=48.02 GAFH01003241.1:143-895(-)
MAVLSLLQRIYCVKAWVEKTMERIIPETLAKSCASGTLLCQLVNKVRPNSIAVFHQNSTSVTQCVHNVNAFNNIARHFFGFTDDDCLLPMAIFNGSDVQKLLASLTKFAESSKTQGLTPTGIEVPTEYPIFTEEETAEARRILCLPQDASRMVPECPTSPMPPLPPPAVNHRPVHHPVFPTDMDGEHSVIAPPPAQEAVSSACAPAEKRVAGPDECLIPLVGKIIKKADVVPAVLWSATIVLLAILNAVH